MAMDLFIGGPSIRSFRGESFIATNPSQDTPVLGLVGASYVETTPTLLLYGSTKTMVVTRIEMVQGGTIATASPEITLGIDTVNRFVSGGTAITISNTMAGGSATTITGLSATIVASAAAATFAKVGTYNPLKLVTGGLCIDYPNGLIIPAGGSFLIYTNSATVAPAWLFNIHVLEV